MRDEAVTAVESTTYGRSSSGQRVPGRVPQVGSVELSAGLDTGVVEDDLSLGRQAIAVRASEYVEPTACRSTGGAAALPRARLSRRCVHRPERFDRGPKALACR